MLRRRAGQDQPFGQVQIEVLLDRAHMLREHLKEGCMPMLLLCLKLNISDCARGEC